MKIIDLLNKIAKGEKVPKRIKYQNEIYTYANDDYCTTNEKWLFSESYTEKVAWLNDFLNDEIEILEEKEIEKIEGSNLINTRDILELEMLINKRFADYDYKINQLIDVINDMRDKE